MSSSVTAPDLGTDLYPHQKKALTFMLEREGERPMSSNSSLWQERYNPISGERSWFHVVTQREVFEEPRPTKGAILADDVWTIFTLDASYRSAADDVSRRWASGKQYLVWHLSVVRCSPRGILLRRHWNLPYRHHLHLPSPSCPPRTLQGVSGESRTVVSLHRRPRRQPKAKPRLRASKRSWRRSMLELVA